MTSLGGRCPVARQVAFVREFRESSRSWTRSALAVRLAQLVAGGVVLALPTQQKWWLDLLILLGLLVAVVSPARNGQAVFLIGAVLAWTYQSEVEHHPPLIRTLLFAVALYAVHNTTTLAATVPMSCQLRTEAWRHWLGRSVTTLAISAPLVGCAYLIDAITTGTTNNGLEFAGLIGVLVVVAVGTTWFTRRLRRG